LRNRWKFSFKGIAVSGRLCRSIRLQEYRMQSGEKAGDAGAKTAVAQLLHDLNQPLSAVNTYAQAGMQLIDNGMDDTARLKELFGKIAAQAARATALGQEIGKAVAAQAAASSR
jgi:C4-dicarboxylate-specific signal transduction histidine kinase